MLLLLLQGRPSAAFAALLFYFYFLKPTLVLGFNLDTSHVIRRDGEPGSLFGFSLATHRQLNPDKRILLIGAPRARALGKQTANITGGLYKCEITQSNDCERIEFDHEEDVQIENKENQWMGVTVQSQGPGGKIVTCAHRYQRRLFVNTPHESYDITGRCYVLSQDLTIDTSFDEDGGNWNFCQGKTRGHEMFGSCQQGLAATFTKDYHYVVFGAPGTYNWQGMVRMEQKNNTLLEMEVYDDGPYETENPLRAHSYLGFSLDSGHKITRGGGLTLVAGAPRFNHSGAVVLLRKNGSRNLLEQHIFVGPGLGSSFGYDVAVVDLNGDGWQDIVVGAPQFYMKNRDIGGAVYVYINQKGNWESVTPVRLNGAKDSMFGQAVESIGDINQDSYEEIAIGAPHDDGGIGKVYIYHGSEHGIKVSPAQILSGKKHNTRLFGYSLAGNMDLDSNSYPDLAVGSLSDRVLIYRARPVIRIRKAVKISPEEIDLTVKTCDNSICLKMDACFAYKANTASYNQKLTISYFVEADGHRRKQGLPPRVTFLNKSHTETYQFNGTLDLRSQEQETCIKIGAKLKDNIKDKMRSIPFEVSVEIVGTKRQRTKNSLPQLLPILDSSQPSKEVTEVNFVKEGCGDICRSNLKMEYKLFYEQKTQDKTPKYSPLPIKDNMPVFHLNFEKKDLAVQVTVNNMNGDDAYEAKLVGTFSDMLSYSGDRSHEMMEKKIICTPNQNGSQTDCELGNPFKRDSETTFYIILSTSSITLDTTEVNFELQLQTTSAQNIAPVKVTAKVVIELPLSVTGEASPNQVSFGGVVKGESAMKTEEEIGSLINYKFTINNLWKSSVKASLHIQWPKSDKDGKWLLYLVNVISTRPQDIRCSPSDQINPLKLQKSSSSSSLRTKREIGERKAVAKMASRSGKNKVLACGNGIECVELRCPLQGLDGTAIELRSRLWNSTFLENYASQSHLDIIVTASLVLDTQAKNMILTAPDAIVKVTVSPENAVAQHSGIPWWIILVAVLVGVLILALLVFLLWKCGFFKRSKQDDSVPRYHAVRIRKEIPEYKDGKVKLDPFEKKQWMTTWVDNESYS
ncbi:integrin alpha-6 isoform X1 [Larimichthys crocea]|uniref:integrin alpha-6 isoform X1 n=1 Tax=Larimichthys crocea TaxID=215358 RepID=UPI000F5D9F27|nr:integrin alpha-6 isoform X1 [Larimichthys crocea]